MEVCGYHIWLLRQVVGAKGTTALIPCIWSQILVDDSIIMLSDWTVIFYATHQFVHIPLIVSWGNVLLVVSIYIYIYTFWYYVYFRAQYYYLYMFMPTCINVQVFYIFLMCILVVWYKFHLFLFWVYILFCRHVMLCYSEHGILLRSGNSYTVVSPLIDTINIQHNVDKWVIEFISLVCVFCSLISSSRLKTLVILTFLEGHVAGLR